MRLGIFVFRKKMVEKKVGRKKKLVEKKIGRHFFRSKICRSIFFLRSDFFVAGQMSKTFMTPRGLFERGYLGRQKELDDVLGHFKYVRVPKFRFRASRTTQNENFEAKIENVKFFYDF